MIYKGARTQAIYEVPCDSCGAKIGEPCKSASGRNTNSHQIREDKYLQKVGSVEFTKRHYQL
jgi:hypothetical protein